MNLGEVNPKAGDEFSHRADCVLSQNRGLCAGVDLECLRDLAARADVLRPSEPCTDLAE